MAAQERIYVTLAEFEQFINLPENADKIFEYVAGEIIEVPSNPLSSEIAMLVGTEIRIYLKHNDIGHVTGEAGGYHVFGERYAPDVAFISYARQPELPYDQQCNPNPPELAVEVISPSDSPESLRIKIANYLAAGTVVWVFNPVARNVEVYVPGQPVRVVGIDGILDGGDILPGFKLAVKDIFRD
ncbi:MAG: Uma2 family endonuclease [Chloroflexi bacterium]|nr:Uma2 family endonuclease [Chloroflexota bacterium]